MDILSSRGSALGSGAILLDSSTHAVTQKPRWPVKTGACYGHAAESGLQTGDIILDVGRRGVNTPAEVRKFVDEARAQSKKSVLLRVMRGDMMVFAAVPIG
jgi:S1-C subfamily serine protease